MYEYVYIHTKYIYIYLVYIYIYNSSTVVACVATRRNSGGSTFVYIHFNIPIKFAEFLILVVEPIIFASIVIDK